MRKTLCILVSSILIAIFLGACSSTQRLSDSPSSSDDVLWLESPPQCAFTEITQISGQYGNTSTFRSDQLKRLRGMMVEQASERGGDAVIKVSIVPVGGGDDSAFEYEGRVIQFEESDCRQEVNDKQPTAQRGGGGKSCA
jgi:hypothetical protein